jgi:hypothetical protein
MGKSWGRHGEGVMDGTWGRWMGYWGEKAVAMARVAWWAELRAPQTGTLVTSMGDQLLSTVVRKHISQLSRNKCAPQAPETYEIISQTDESPPVSIQTGELFHGCRHITQAPQAMEPREIGSWVDSVYPKHCGVPEVSQMSTYNASVASAGTS